MASRLSSMLVRDGIVGVKRLEKAFRRQVVYGGSLDTVLLEMGLVAEERLCQYLALSSGLPPAGRDDLPASMLRVVAAMLPELVAGEHRVVPLGKDGDALRVAVHAPVNMDLLEDLADSIDCALQPMIVPEYRWHVWFGKVYGGTPLERFISLASELDTDAVLQPVGRTQTIIIDDSDETSKPASVGPTHPTMRIAAFDPMAGSLTVSPTDAPQQLPQSARRITLRGIEPAKVIEMERAHGSLGSHGADPTPQRLNGLAEPADSPRDTLRMAPSLVEPAPQEPSRVRRRTSNPPSNSADQIAQETPLAPGFNRAAAPSAEAPNEPSKAGARSGPLLAYSELPSDGGFDARQTTSDQNPTSRVADAIPLAGSAGHSNTGKRAITSPVIAVESSSPLAPRLARQLLASAESRDAIFVILLRAARYRTRWAGILTVQGGAAIGRLALAESGIATSEFTTVLIPLEMKSGFHTAAITKLPYVGPLRSDDVLDMMLRKMGGVVPAMGVVMPVIVKDRVVALMVAHRLDRELLQSDVSDILALDKAISDALSKVILRSKSTQPIASSAHQPLLTNDITQPYATQPANERAATPMIQTPVEQATHAIDAGPEVELIVEPPRTIEELLDNVDSALPSAAEDAMEEVAQRAAEALPHLEARFPGQLRIDRFAVTGGRMRAAQYGGLLELVVRIGPAATDLLVTKMSSTQRDIRFYATVCAAELRPRGAINALVERLFDSDLGVRACAVDALKGYSPRDLDAAMTFARHALHSGDLARVNAASKAIADLLDLASIPDLLTAMNKGTRFAEAARATLILLCRQDFGNSERRWRHWWDDNQKKHRIEWLIDALSHKDSLIRQAAIDDLRRITGEHFGYHHDMGKKDRDVTQSRWQNWWRDAGQRKFGS
jgi:hypothetical protein